MPSPENVVPLGWLWRFAPLGPESRDNLIRGTGLLRRRDGHVPPEGVFGPRTHDSVDGSGIISGFRESFLKFSDVLRPRRARTTNLRCLGILCESHPRRYRRKQNRRQNHDSSTCDVVMAHGDYLLAHAGCIVGASGPPDRVVLTSCTVAESRDATASQRCHGVAPSGCQSNDSGFPRRVSESTRKMFLPRSNLPVLGLDEAKDIGCSRPRRSRESSAPVAVLVDEAEYVVRSGSHRSRSGVRCSPCWTTGRQRCVRSGAASPGWRQSPGARFHSTARPTGRTRRPPSPCHGVSRYWSAPGSEVA